MAKKSGAGWGNVLAAGINGYLLGDKINKADAASKADAEWKAKERARTETKWKEEDDLKSGLKSASNKVGVEEGANGVIKPASMDNRDVGQPGEAPLAGAEGSGAAAGAGSAAAAGANVMAQAAAADAAEAQDRSDEAQAAGAQANANRAQQVNAGVQQQAQDAAATNAAVQQAGIDPGAAIPGVAAPGAPIAATGAVDPAAIAATPTPEQPLPAGAAPTAVDASSAQPSAVMAANNAPAAVPGAATAAPGVAIAPPAAMPQGAAIAPPDAPPPQVQAAAAPVAIQPLAPNKAAGQSAGAFRVGDKTFKDRGEAEAHAAEQNSPQAIAGRQADVYMQMGMPEKAALVQERQTKMEEQARKFKENGVLDALKSFRSGDQKTAVAGLKKAGLFDITDGPITMTPKMLDIPGAGQIQTYDMTFQHKTADGKVEPMTVNSHYASLAMLPYEKQLEFSRKATDTDSKIDTRLAQMDFKGKQLELQQAIGEARIAKMQASGGGGGNRASGSDRDAKEQRITTQTLIGNANAQIREIDAAMKEAKKDLTPSEAAKDAGIQEMVKQRAQLNAHRTDLNNDLSELVARKAPDAAAGKRTDANVAPKNKDGHYTPTTQAQFDALPVGAVFINPKDGKPFVKKAKK